MIVPVVLSGGSGTRLWPLSREHYPKQLLPLVSEQTMLQETVSRLSGIPDLSAPIVVCNESHRFMVAEQLRQIGFGASTIMLEPVGRNTAPAVAVAALQAMKTGEDPFLLVLSADHVILNPEALCDAVNSLRLYVEQGSLATFGIVPTGPETGYGYIKAGGALIVPGCGPGSEVDSLAPEPSSVCAVEEFVEKPDLKTAQGYLAAGDYYWNSGMFFFKASRYLEELERFAPQMLACCRSAFEQGTRDLDFLRLDKVAFSACPSNSIDYAVMENTDRAAVLPLNAGWSDVGSWAALWEVGQKNEDGNVVKGDVLINDSRNCYLHASTRLLAVVGLEDVVAVETGDAVLVAHKDRVQDVKAIVEQLKLTQRAEHLLHKRVNRPWGAYEGIDAGPGFQVKRITVNPGATLSLQMHYHRAEHWIVVKGTAGITCGEKEFVLSENQSTYIPLGVTHRLENPGKIPLELIEVQSGSYLGEDDIVRFEDIYGRSSCKEPDISQ